MNRNLVYKTITIIAVGLIFLTGILNFGQFHALAVETTCPESMSASECLAYLQKQSQEIAKQKAQIQGNLNNVKYEQLSLNQRITYLNSQIQQTETEIQGLEVEIETKNVEIKILGQQILETENRVNTVTQEINTLKTAIDKRVVYSYKYSFTGLFELLLESDNLDTLTRKMKYLAETRKKDVTLLEDMNKKEDQLTAEKEELAKHKEEVQNKRMEIEKKKGDLFNTKQELANQQSEQQTLYAISKQKEAEYQANLNELKSQEDNVTSQISSLIMSLYNSGQLPANTPVKSGDIIGYQGHTGFSYGSHLHFNINNGAVNPFNGYLTTSGGRVYSGSASAPLGDGAYLTQTCHSPGCSIDMVGTSNWINNKYYVAPNSVCCTGYVSYLGCVQSGWYSLNGEGTPVRAIKDGKVTSVFTDSCGGKALIVDHGAGETSLYLHLR